ncbi:ABC-2 transporter permease [Lachnotalea glycerini]|uniref:ABC-2 transporter permease n=1 Tax=Lachnotalea glycerini TaxID=1763509 RepID=A0A371JB73_9FIRM|nr:ABC-2 transporter permease [Lachnotalea glycerini]RDY30021.1 ABC-2 transporter permease [Lachnotalea glycerini]
MNALVLKEWYQIRHTMKNFIIMILILAVVFGYSHNSSTFLWVVELLCFSTIITVFNMDEKSGWNKYERVLQISVSKKVWSKYIFMVYCVLAGAIIGIMGGLIMDRNSYEVIIGNLLPAVMISILLGSVMIPLIYKYGTEKMRILFIGILLATMLGVSAAIQVFINLNLIFVILYIMPIVSILLMILSVKISIRIYQKKEF